MATEAAATAAMRGKVGTETTSNAGQRHLVRVIGTPVTFRTPPGIPLLHGMIAAGASAVPVGCRGGGCGICRIHVLSGPYHSLPINRNRISETDEATGRSEEHTSELQSLMRISYAVFCLKKKKNKT